MSPAALGLLRRADLWAGLMFAAFGAFALWAGADYPLGRAGRVGPGYVPRLLAIALLGLGLVLVVRAAWTRDQVDAHVAWRPALLVFGSVLLFAVVFQAAGLLPAIAASVIVANFAAPDNGWRSALVLSAVLAAFAWALFVQALRLPIPVFWP